MNNLIDRGRQPDSPPLQGRGKGWGLSDEQIAELHRRAREMRNNPTEPERRLWNSLRGSQLDGYKFRRQEVVGRAIADFFCPKAGLIVEVDGETHADPTYDRRRDAYLRGFGHTVLHVTNHDVMRNIEGVLWTIQQALGLGNNPHPNPSPEGEGLLGKFDGMTVNERLSEAGLTVEYMQAKREGDIAKINAVLAKVDLQQDANGMNWTKLSNAPNP